MNLLKQNIPNTITCINILAGVAAIFFTFSAQQMHAGLSGLQWSYIFIGIAAVADFMDGLSARLLHTYSDLGKELDSLCDAVSFGVAPAACLFATMQHFTNHPTLGWIAPLIAVAGVLRLARFNVDTRQTSSFIGLPIPANAIFWIGYTALICQGYDFLASPVCLIPVVFIECWLMISNLKLFSLKSKNLGWKGNQRRWALLIGCIILVAVFKVAGLFYSVLYYIVLSLCLPKMENE